MSIRARIFFVFMAAVIAGFTLLALWIREDVSDRYSESFEEVMVDSVNLLAEMITTDITNGDTSLPETDGQGINLQGLDDVFQRLHARRLSAQVYELEKTHVDIRVYVTDKKGKVIFDSDNGKAVGEDYSQWRDVYRTLRGEYGARATKILGEKSMGDPSRQLTVAYVAAPIYHQSEIVGVITLAKPKHNIDRFVANAKNNLIKAVLFSIFMALLLGLMLYIWVSRPLQTLADYANRVSSGERVSLPQLGNNEIGEVGIAMENMRQALEDKQYVESYVQSLTHELKSPLTAIHAAAELLEQELPAEKRAQFAGSILKETERLNEFASQLLQLASLEKRPGIEKTAAMDLEVVVQDVIESHVVECQAKKLTTTSNVSSNAMIDGDTFLTRQAIDNLYRNAIDFSPNGGEICFELQDQNDAVTLKVIDQGPGIPEFAKARIFERFYSLPRPETGLKGCGLGLNFAREVAEQHGGSLMLKNLEPGTCAQLCLPKAGV